MKFHIRFSFLKHSFNSSTEAGFRRKYLIPLDLRSFSVKYSSEKADNKRTGGNFDFPNFLMKFFTTLSPFINGRPWSKMSKSKSLLPLDRLVPIKFYPLSIECFLAEFSSTFVLSNNILSVWRPSVAIIIFASKIPNSLVNICVKSTLWVKLSSEIKIRHDAALYKSGSDVFFVSSSIP